MIAVDTNILVYAHREDSSWHAAAEPLVRTLAEASRPWAIPWPCLHEFAAIVTHPRIYSPPSSATAVLAQIDAWIESPSLVLLSEGPGYWASLRAALETSRVTGAQVHDARIAALCIHHQVRELWAADRDFSRFATLATRNPLVASRPPGDP
jgi:toxin-antitoxin system PIN domain toxin